MERQPLIYTFSRRLLKTWFVIWHRYQTYGEEQVPKDGGCILASNHASFLDPPLVGCNISHRFVRFMPRNTLLTNRLVRWWMLHVGVVKLDRTKGDVGAMKTALAVLKAGGVLCLFPEGTRTPDGHLQTPKRGIGFLIAKARVPVVPAYIEGSFEACPKGVWWIRPRKVTVYYGKPILPEELVRFGEDKEGYEQMARWVMSRIAALKPTEKKACITPSNQ